MSEQQDHGTVAIYPLRYTAGDLQRLPEEEVIFFLMCGQLQNDIVVLLRQILQARVVEGDAEPLRLAAATAAMLNMRTLAARLSEGWKLIKDRFQLVFRSYEEAIDETARQDLAWLKPYFSGPNLVRTIRDNAVAHFDQEVARDAFRKLSPEEPLIDLHAHTEGNTIYFSGETLMLAALIHLSPKEDPAAALDGMADEIIQVGRRLGNVLRAYLRAFSERHLPDKLERLKDERVLIERQPRLSAFATSLYLASSPRSAFARQLLTGASPLAINGFGRPPGGVG